MSKNHDSTYRMVIVVLSVILILTLVQSPRTTQAAPQAAGAQMLGVQVFEVDCLFSSVVSPTYASMGNMATFITQSSDSIIEITFNGRIFVNSFTESNGALFELRVDGAESSVGWARANLWKEEISIPGVPVSITGVFTDLKAGEHTASMWVRTLSGSASLAELNPGCWGGDVLIVKEHLPFGVAYMPMISK